MGKTLAEKILAKHSGTDAYAGDQVIAQIDKLMSHEGWRRVATVLEEAKLKRLWDPNRVIIILDHAVPAPDEESASTHAMIRQSVEQFGIPAEHFYDVRGGISHQVMVERGHVLPGELIVGTDSHSTLYGALGCAGTGIGMTEAAYVVAAGKLWFRVPSSILISLMGQLPTGVMTKDVILYLCGQYGSDIAQYKSIEYSGAGAQSLSVEARMTMTNMGVELGAKFAFFAPDEQTIQYLQSAGVSTDQYEVLQPDPDAVYEQRFEVDLSRLAPQIACPYTVDNVKSITEVDEQPIQQAYIGSCTNARIEDLRAAAKILAGHQVAAGVRLYISPASQMIYKMAAREGLLEQFLDAGAVILNPGCGPCFGKHLGLLGKDETCISSSNRNFRGRMGSNEAQVYLASPLTVAASAITGHITDPRTFLEV
jgi:homoaconitate hydratase family protein